MSNLIDFDESDNLFGSPNNPSQSNKPSKSVDDIFGTGGNANQSNTLDDIFTSAPDDDIFQPQKQKKEKDLSKQSDDLFGDDADDDDDFFGFGTNFKKTTNVEDKANTGSLNPLDDFFDSFMQLPSTPSGPQGLQPDLAFQSSNNQSDFTTPANTKSDTKETEMSESTEKSHSISYDVSNDSLDDLLEAQPSGTVSSNDDLFSILERDTKPVSPSKIDTKESKQLFEEAPPLNADNNQSESTKKAPVKSHDEEHDSLDDLLEAQPSGTVSTNDDLFSIFDRASNLVTPSETKTETKETKVVLEAPSLKSDGNQSESRKKAPASSHDEAHDSLDDLLEGQPSGTVSTNDDLFSIFDRASNLVTPSEAKTETKETKVVLEAPSLKSDGNQSESRKKAPASSHDEAHDSLDDLLEGQPSGTVSTNDDLFSIFDRASNLVTPSETKTETKETKVVLEAPSLKSDGNQSESRKKAPASSHDESNDSLDDLLDAQPSGTVSTNDDLFSIFDRATDKVTPNKIKTNTKDTKKVFEAESLKSNINQSDSREKSHGISKEESHDSLDDLLEAQPSGTVPSNDDLFSIFDRATDTVTPSKTKTDTKDTKKVFEAEPLKSNINQSESREKSHDMSKEESHDSLDDLLEAQPSGTVPGNDDLFSIFDRASKQVAPSKTKTVTKETKNITVEAPLLKSKSNQSESSGKSHGMPLADSHDSLDDLLDGQPMGTVPDNDDLLSIFDRATKAVTPTKTKKVTKETKKDPSDDLFGTAVTAKTEVTEEEDTVDTVGGDQQGLAEEETQIERESERETEEETIRNQKRFKVKKSMERSFDDLLNGLSDESEPELDDMIVSDDNDNTNIESLLETPNKRQPVRPSGLDDFLTPSRPLEPSVTMDVVTSTPNADHLEYSDNEDGDEQIDMSEVKATTPEVKIHTPDDEELDLKSWEMVDDGDNDDNDDNEDRNNSGLVQMRKHPARRTSTDEGELDLSTVEDKNRLDVDLNKHKSALGKQGSLALRRKPSRKGRKSLLSAGEDAIFQDSTEPRTSTQLNGEDAFDGKDDDNYDMSPPAKKPSPGMMIPLPGMRRPPSQRLSASSPDEESEGSNEIRRVSKPPPGAFKLPSVLPKPKSRTSVDPVSPSKSRADSASPVFDKPVLKKAESKVEANVPKSTFSVPVLKRVGEQEPEKKIKKASSEERDVMFERPALRSTPKAVRDRNTEEKPETNNGIFTKPPLKSTPKSRPGADRKEHEGEIKDTDHLETKNGRSTPGRDVERKSKPESQKHVFDKPRLRSTGSRSGSVDDEDSQRSDIGGHENAKTFQKPVLRTASKDLRSNSIDDTKESVIHTFDKPVLKSTPHRANRDTDIKAEQIHTGTFDKPALKRATPSPEKEVKDLTEPKGMFDKPSLRKTDKSKIAEQKGKSAEKPSWLQEAANKHSNVLGVLHAKENQNNSVDKQLPPWMEKAQQRKNSQLQPLQDRRNNQSESHDNEEYVKQTTPVTRSRESSIGSENEVDRKKRSGSSSESSTKHNNYSPSWMRQGRSPSTPNVAIGLTAVTPSNSNPTLPDSEEVPLWKRELAQRKQSRKDSPAETPKRELSAEPEWKKNVALKKVRPTATPSKEVQSVEPEWKKAAEEKRARLRMSAPPGQYDRPGHLDQ